MWPNPPFPCGFGQIYWRNPWWKTSFFVQCTFLLWGLKQNYGFIQVMIEKGCIGTNWVKVWFINVVRCAIWYHQYNLKAVKNTHERVLLLVKFTKSNTPPSVFFTFLKLCKWYHIAQWWVMETLQTV